MSKAPQILSARCVRPAIRWIPLPSARAAPPELPRHCVAVLRKGNAAWRGRQFLKQLHDRGFQLFRLGLGRIARHGTAVAVDQEFGEIPFDRFGAKDAGLFVAEIAEQGMGIWPLDLDFGEDRKRHAIILLAEGADLFSITRFLLAKLVTGKAQYGQALWLQLFVERLKAAIL